MNQTSVKYRDIDGLGSEHLETCVRCQRRFDLRDVRLDGDGQFRCITDSFGPHPQSIAEANRLLRDYLIRNPEVIAKIEDFQRGPQEKESPLDSL
jgi:hypothetical protein